MKPLYYVYAVLALFVLGAGAAGVLTYKHMAQQAAQLKGLQADYNALAKSYKTLSAQVIKRAEFDTALRKQRTDINSKLDEVQRNDPTAADYLGTRVPDSVREAILHPTRRVGVPPANKH